MDRASKLSIKVFRAPKYKLRFSHKFNSEVALKPPQDLARSIQSAMYGQENKGKTVKTQR
jgi:hypothetical protein